MVYAKEIQPEVLLLAATAGISPRSVSITKNFVMLVSMMRGCGVTAKKSGWVQYR